MKLGDMKIDSDAIERGAWKRKIPGMPGLALHVRGIGNIDYRRLQTKLVEKIPAKDRRNGLDIADADQIEDECLKATILLGWEGVEDDEGQPLPYSPEKAAELIENPDFAMFRSAVIWAANRVAEKEDEGIEALSGN